jgi:hypothetical protein
MKLPPRKGCRSIVTLVTCVIPLTEQQLTTTSIVTAIVIAGTTIVTAPLPHRKMFPRACRCLNNYVPVASGTSSLCSAGVISSSRPQTPFVRSSPVPSTKLQL